ncbi:MAG TPA: M56 family metallopeptidase [Vicinamibacterales bacterium]|nr:M56 family metallopeptidase [Vicinamibacterales bacterium]
MIFTLDLALKASLIAAAALAATTLLRAQSAAVRHWVLTVSVVCVAALPLLSAILPTWQIPFATAVPSRAAVQSSPTVTVAIMPQSGAASEPPEPRNQKVEAENRFVSRFPARVSLLPVWLVGAVAGGLVLIVGLIRLRAIAATATRLDTGHWADLVADVAREAGVRRPIVLLQSDDPTLLVTWGMARPKIVLPSVAGTWDEQRARIVLQHELAHIRRGDWLAQMVAQAVLALNWFNPVLWIACRRLQRESEQACDDAVLRTGVDPADYASHLLELARTLTRRRAVPAPAMARPSTLEGRIAAMLDAHLNRNPLSSSVRIATAVVLMALTASLAAVAAQRYSTFSGTLTDQTNAVLPNIAVTLTNPGNGAKYEVRSDRTGHFEFVGLPDGEYALAADEPGFAPFKDPVTIAGRNIDRTIQLQLGSLMETIRVTSGPSPWAPSSADKRAEYREAARKQRQEIMDRCAASGGTGAIGGNIKQPTKVVDVKPSYPERLSDAKIGGVIVLDAVIGTDGTVSDVNVISGADPELDSAAVEAVRQWEFSTTFLNCTPVDVHMKVHVNFVAQP